MKKDTIPDGYLRVTDCLKPFKNFSAVQPEILQQAQDRGNLVHQLCELYALNLLIEEPPEHVKGYVNSFIKWFDENVEEVINTEERLNCDGYMISGRYDMLVKLKNNHIPVILDLKTSSNYCNTWPLQVSAYSYLYMLNIQDKPVASCAVLKLDKHGKRPKFTNYLDAHKYFDLYLKALELYRFLQ